MSEKRDLTKDLELCEAVIPIVNLNDHVRVKLTQTGRKILLRQCKKFNLPYAIDADGHYGAQLYEMMSIFGQEMFVGCQTPFVNNAIEFLGWQTETMNEPDPLPEYIKAHYKPGDIVKVKIIHGVTVIEGE